jgi:hypothetical protein
MSVGGLSERGAGLGRPASTHLDRRVVRRERERPPVEDYSFVHGVRDDCDVIGDEAQLLRCVSTP